MIRALAIKELRESAGLAALAGLGMLWMVFAHMGINPLKHFTPTVAGKYTIPFVTGEFFDCCVLFLGGLAVLLGLKQTAWEHGKGTYYFLWWRPVSRRIVLGVKITIGLVLVLGILALSIIIYGWWVVG